MKHYEMTMEDLEDEVYGIGMVKTPAIQRTYEFLSADEKKNVQLSVLDEERRICVGAILIPDMKIVRGKDPDNIYTISFPKDEVRKFAHQYSERGYANRTTLEHDYMTWDVFLAESWIVEDTEKDKSAIFDLDLPEGTWAGVMKVNNDEVWEDVKLGKYQGFSVEVTATPREKADEEMSEEDKALLDFIKQLS